MANAFWVKDASHEAPYGDTVYNNKMPCRFFIFLNVDISYICVYGVYIIRI